MTKGMSVFASRSFRFLRTGGVSPRPAGCCANSGREKRRQTASSFMGEILQLRGVMFNVGRYKRRTGGKAAGATRAVEPVAGNACFPNLGSGTRRHHGGCEHGGNAKPTAPVFPFN